MSPRPDRLAKQLVDAAVALLRRRPWTEFHADPIFRVRVPTEELPLAAAVIGRDGEEHDLLLVRGELALRRLSELLADAAEVEAYTDTGDFLSVTFEAWRDLPDEHRRLLQAAGLQARREALVPVALVRRPHELARQPGRADQRTLVWVLRGLLAAYDAGELRPLAHDSPETADSGDPASQRLLELEIAGELRKPTVTARLVPWPEEVGELDPATLIALPRDLRKLPRRAERWLLARIPLAARIEGDERSQAAVVVAHEGGLILQTEVVSGGDLAAVAGLLTRALRGEGPEGRPGRPHEILLDDARLQRSLEPVLRDLAIDAVLDPEHPPLVALLDELASYSPELVVARRVEPPEPLARWKAVSKSVTSKVVAQTMKAERPPERALIRYFGPGVPASNVLARFKQLGVADALLEWLAADYRARESSKTHVEKLLARKRIDAPERQLLEARRDARLSIFRVDACSHVELGGSLEVEDVLSGARHTLHDRALSQTARAGLFLPLRLLQVEEWVLPLIAGPPLTQLDVLGALEELERFGAKLTPAGLRRDAHLLGRLWTWLPERREIELRNTSGDEIELHDAAFTVEDAEAVRRALDARDELEYDEQQGVWTWVRGRTALALLELHPDRLLLEVNSAARLAATRKWLEAIPGVRFEGTTVHELDDDGESRGAGPRDPSPRAPSELRPVPSAEVPTTEALELLERFVREQAHRWLDERVPMLGNRTPRDVCKTAKGRERVARIVRTMPDVSSPGGAIPVPREELLRELGIS